MLNQVEQLDNSHVQLLFILQLYSMDPYQKVTRRTSKCNLKDVKTKFVVTIDKEKMKMNKITVQVFLPNEVIF